ncbi:hypothetical protein [Mesorhizobium xinjiangense]|uniref:hypothetical protein n=1 Tax=Mesorhizobium xinjiangense TaxID=2678685 RepID=UPI0012EE24C9|nr:hypothetical protein [Mesorhizobium xinjiangense]
MLGRLRHWIDYRRALRARWQYDAKRLLAAEQTNAYYEAQRRATRARVRREKSEIYHWAKVAAEVARLSPQVEMNITVLTHIVDDEERRNR